ILNGGFDEEQDFMKSSTCAVFRAVAAFTFVGASNLQAGTNETDPPKLEQPPNHPERPPLTWRLAVVPGPAVTLRLKRPVGKSMIYQGTLERDQKAASSYHEADAFYLNALCASQEDGRDMVAMLRSFIDRKRTEKLENGKQLERSLENSTELIDMGPNFNTVGTNLRCYE